MTNEEILSKLRQVGGVIEPSRNSIGDEIKKGLREVFSPLFETSEPYLPPTPTEKASGIYKNPTDFTGTWVAPPPSPGNPFVGHVDKEPEPTDGPDYHQDHAAWTERNSDNLYVQNKIEDILRLLQDLDHRMSVVEEEIVFNKTQNHPTVETEILEINDAVRQSYTTFAGADVTVKINGKACGTISGIEWTWKRVGPNKQYWGTLIETMFDHSLLKDIDEPFTMELWCANEYGAVYQYIFENVKLERRTANWNMDMIVMETHYGFTASGMTEGIPQ